MIFNSSKARPLKDAKLSIDSHLVCLRRMLCSFAAMSTRCTTGTKCSKPLRITCGFEEVAQSEDALSYTPTQSGAYRAEVRMVPYHLGDLLEDEAPLVLAGDRVWIYSNPIYIH